MPYPSPTARSRLTFELSRQTGLRRKPKGNIFPCIVDPQAAAAASGEEDITEGGDNNGGNQGGGTTGGELEG